MPLNAYAMNSTMPLGSSFASTGLGTLFSGSIFFLILTIGLLYVLFMLVSSEKVLRFFINLKKKVRYTFIGFCTLGIGYGMYRFVKLCGTQVQNGDPIILKVIGIGVGSIILATIIGYLVDKYFIQKFKDNLKKAKKNI